MPVVVLWKESATDRNEKKWNSTFNRGTKIKCLMFYCVVFVILLYMYKQCTKATLKKGSWFALHASEFAKLYWKTFLIIFFRFVLVLKGSVF